MAEIDDTLRELDRWYRDIQGDNTRPSLLSKLAILELCGWIELRFDSLVHFASDRVGLDREWVEANVVQRTFGFAYGDHLRQMLCRVVGESAVLLVETAYEEDNPGKLEMLKSSLGTLWKSRDVLAHTHSAAGSITMQKVLHAPSWALNQYRVIAKMIDQYETSLARAFSRSIAKPG